MDESLRRFRDPAATAVLADLLCGLITDIRRILMHPDLRNDVKLAAIATAVDELAPPPEIPELPAAAWRAVDGFLVPRQGTPADGRL